MIDLSGITSQKVFLVEAKGEAIIVSPLGEAIEFRHTTVVSELNAILEILNESDVPQLVVDLNHGEYFGSVIIGAINTMISRMKDKGGRVVTCCASEEMRKVINVMGLSEHWPDYPTRRKAIKAVKA